MAKFLEMPHNADKTNSHKDNVVSLAAMTLWWETYELWDQVLLGVGDIYNKIQKPRHTTHADERAGKQRGRRRHRQELG